MSSGPPARGEKRESAADVFRHGQGSLCAWKRRGSLPEMQVCAGRAAYACVERRIGEPPSKMHE